MPAITSTAPEPAPYLPLHGEKCLVTVEATLSVDRAWGARFDLADPDGATRISVPASAAVRVEPLPKPALPTAFGSMIVAKVVGEGGEHELVLADLESKRPWRSEVFVGESLWFAKSEITLVRVLHDPGIEATDGSAEVGVADPPKAGKSLGEVAYLGFFKAREGRPRRGGLPSWDELSQETRGAWQAAAEAVRDEVSE